MERENIQVTTTKKNANTVLITPHGYFSKRSPNTTFRISYDFYWQTLIREYTLTSYIGTTRLQPIGNSFHDLIVKRGDFEMDVGEGLKTNLPPSIPEHLRDELIEKITYQTKMEIKPWESKGYTCYDFDVRVAHYVTRGPDDFMEIPISEDGFLDSSSHAVPPLNQAIESLDCKNVMLPCGILKEFCSICHEGFPMGSEMAKMGCSHWFHGQCIKTWLETKQTCPVCRYKRSTTSTS